MSAPFRRILVAYDGSEPAERALAFGMALGRAGTALDIVHVVDATLERQGRALLDAARERAAAAGIEVTTSLVNRRPIPAIADAAKANGDELVILGTHARSDVPHTFLGSTTEGVLRSGTFPVLVVTAAMTPPSGLLFRDVLVAVDESDAADKAVTLAAGLSRTVGARCVLCNVADTRNLYAKALTYGYDPAEFVDQMRAHGRDVVERAREQAGFAADMADVTVVEDEPAPGIIAEAERSGAAAIVIGSHGRRGLQRFFLGSIAEHVVRHSPIPVVVVRALTRKQP